ncbi:MAG TPA: hypothetical protein VFQ32_06235 [Ktedonobacterales bacterium]|nr:hypothetical protein [Ktedonobacterales bacterium]
MTITYAIPGVPLLNQLKEESNPTYDCVFESNAAMATAYLHKPFTGTQIKAMDTDDYGPGYTGGASEAKLVDTMARLGIRVTRIAEPTQEQLLDALHWQISHYHRACIITMPSQWNSAVTSAGKNWNPRTYRGPTHVGLACGTGPDGAIRVMNPWGGFWHDGDGEYWKARLLEGGIWVGTLIEEGKNVGNIVPSGWKDDGKTLVAPNGVPIIRGFRDYVLSYAGGGWEANNWPLKPEQSIAEGSIEPGNASIGPGSRQDFRYRSLGWTAARNVYVIYSGQDLLALESQLAAANQHISQLEEQLKQLQNQTPPPPTADAKAAEAMAALVELARALKLVETAT